MFLLSKNTEEFDKKITELIINDYNEKIPYTNKLLLFATQKTPIFVVIDNVDQFEEDSVQSDIFSDSIALASKLGINLIIAMRESTYINHRNSPTFDAFDFDPIHIEPPEIPAVLSRRFFLTSQLLSGKSGKFTSLNGADFKVDDLSVFIEIVKSSVLGTEVGDRIDVLSNHDVRLALRMTREFLARGYTDPAKALTTYTRESRYTLPKQEAFRSILLGNQSVYSEEYSVIGNPLDSRLGRSNGELLRLFVLSALVKKSSANGSNYIDGPEIRENINKIGFSESDTLDVLRDLCELKFIHTRSHGKAEITASYFASRLGGHIVRNLLGDFTFIESIMMDTFISDKEKWNHIKELSQQVADERNVVKRVKFRTDRASFFFDYMIEEYKKLYSEASKRNLDPIWLGNPLLEMRNSLNDDLKRANDSAKRNYGKITKRKRRDPVI